MGNLFLSKSVVVLIIVSTQTLPDHNYFVTSIQKVLLTDEYFSEMTYDLNTLRQYHWGCWRESTAAHDTAWRYDGNTEVNAQTCIVSRHQRTRGLAWPFHIMSIFGAGVVLLERQQELVFGLLFFFCVFLVPIGFVLLTARLPSPSPGTRAEKGYGNEKGLGMGWIWVNAFLKPQALSTGMKPRIVTSLMARWFRTPASHIKRIALREGIFVRY